MSETAIESAETPKAQSKGSQKLTGPEKAGVVMLRLGDELAQQVMDYLDDTEREQISLAIAKAHATRETTLYVLNEFNTSIQAGAWMSEGGIEYARKLLIASVGPRKAEEIIERIQKDLDDTGLNVLRKADPEQLRMVLLGEHPQTIALIMAHLDARQCSEILEGVENDFAAEIIYRIGSMEKVSPEMLEIVETALGGIALDATLSAAGGPAQVAGILNHVSSSVEKGLMDLLSQRDAELSIEVRNMMFTFDDIVRLSDRDLQKVITKVEQRDLAIALKTANADLLDKFLRNMANRQVDALKDTQSTLGGIRRREVDAAQARIISLLRDLEAENEIVISTGGEGDELVD